jgi:hypothetical protein
VKAIHKDPYEWLDGTASQFRLISGLRWQRGLILMKLKLRLIIFYSRSIATALVFCMAAISSFAQSAKSTARTDTDASWAKAYAVSCGSTGNHQCPPSTNGYENAFNGDVRLPGLLERSLHQQQSWWVNGHAGSAPVSSIVQEFIGVPRDLFVDNDRYVTATGCVPHDCTTNGMLWIDTDAHPASVIFVAEVMINSVKGGDNNHLWIYASAHQNFETLPSNFLSSLKRWHDSISTKMDPQSVTVVTLVQPNGRTVDLTYDTVFYNQNMPVYPRINEKR